jgi:hypothetical protein
MNSKYWQEKSVLSRFWIHFSVFSNKLYIKIKLIVQAFQIYNYLLTEIIMKRIIWHRTFSRNKMARKLSVFSSLMSNYSFHDNFCQKIIIYLESLYNKPYLIFSPFCSVKKSVLSRFWIHLSVFPNKLYIKIKLIVQAFQTALFWYIYLFF